MFKKITEEFSDEDKALAAKYYDAATRLSTESGLRPLHAGYVLAVVATALVVADAYKHPYWGGISLVEIVTGTVAQLVPLAAKEAASRTGNALVNALGGQA